MIFWIKTFQLLLSLAILIILHEGGHFLAAKLFGIRVEKFFLFFDYKRHLISTRDAWVQRLFPRVKNWETEYGIGWIPLGGYVKIAGMIDESMDTEQMAHPVEPWEFRAKRPWQRLIVMLGGVFMNMVTAMAIYAGIMWTAGSDSIPMEGNFADGFYFNERAHEMGFEDGDRLVRLDTTLIAEYSMGQILLDMAESRTVTVERDGYETVILLPEEFPLLSLLKDNPPFFAPLSESYIDSVAAGSPADRAGIQTGARLLAVDDVYGVLTDIRTWNRFDELMSRRADVLAAAGCTHADSARMSELTVQFQNPGDSLCAMARLELGPDYLIGISKRLAIMNVSIDHTDYSLLEAIPEGCKMGWQQLVDYVGQMKYLFSAEGARSVGSFGTIGSIFPSSFDWLRFWSLTAFISVMLAFMNVLPIPGLDGGHALFTIIEMTTGYTFSEKFQERAINVGFFLILMLMILAISNDIMKFVFHA